MAEKLEFRFDLLKGQTTIIEALDEASKKATGFKAVLGDVGDSAPSFLKLSTAVAVGTAAFEMAKNALHSFIGVLESGIDAAIEKENAINKLNLSLAQTGKYTDAASEDFLAYAETLRKTTRYTDDQIIANAAYLESLTALDTEGLKKATKASADLAATLGIDLHTATSLVAKSIEGNSGALGRYGIQVKKGADETENLTNTLKALSQFSGRAEADANTFGGAIVKMKNALGETYTALGQVITQNPIFIEMINRMGAAFNHLSEFIVDNRGEIISFVNGAINSLGQALIKLNPLFNFILGSMTNILGIIRLSIQGWNELYNSISQFEIINEIIGTFVTGLLEIPKGIIQLIQLLNELANSSEFVSKAFKKAGIDTGDLDKNLQGVSDKIEDIQIQSAKISLPKVYAEGLSNLDQLIGKSQEFLSAQNDAIKNIGNEVIKISDKTLNTQKAVVKNQKDIIVESDTFFTRLGGMFSSWSDFSKKVVDAFSKPDRLTGLTKFETFLDQAGPTFIGNITKGIEGLRSNLTNLATGIGDAILPGLGKITGPFFEMFSKGPEFTKQMIKEFINGIPTIINALIESIPALITALAESLPVVATKLAVLLVSGQFVFKLAEGLIKAFASLPALIWNGIKDGLAEIPKTFIGALIIELPKFIGKLVEGAGEFVFKILEGGALFVANIVAGAAQFTWNIISGAAGFIFEIIKGAGAFTFEIIKGAGLFTWEIIKGAASFVGQILEGAANFVWEIIKGAGSFIAELVKGVGKGIGNFVTGIPVIGDIIGGIGDFFGSIFAKGGLVKPLYAATGLKVPPIEPKGTDTVPAMLTPGEYVVDRTLTTKLDKFLNDQTNQRSMNSLLTQILFELKKPQTVSSEITLNKKTFADIMLELSRSNARTA